MGAKLSDLSPRWIAFEGNQRALLLFRCPHCRAVWLTATTTPMTIKQQMLALGEDRKIHGRNADTVVPVGLLAWKDNGKDFDGLSLTPSIDASRSGHWHGFITDGRIT